MKKSNLLAAGLLVAGMCLSTSCSDNTFVAATPDEDVTAGFDKPTLALVNESGKEVKQPSRYFRYVLPGHQGTRQMETGEYNSFPGIGPEIGRRSCPREALGR